MGNETTQTWFRGISCPTIERKQYMMADSVTARGAFVFPQTWQPVPLNQLNRPQIKHNNVTI